jgi:hypothetical protein
MSEDKKNDQKEKNNRIDVKEYVTSMPEYDTLLESTSDENKEDFKKALEYYSAQWQGVVDALTGAAESKEVREGFMEELQKRFGQKDAADN